MDKSSLSSISSAHLSNNVRDILESTSWVNNFWDSEQLKIIASEVLPYLETHAVIDLRGLLASNHRFWMSTISKLELAKNQQCLCRVVLDSDSIDPKNWRSRNKS